MSQPVSNFLRRLLVIACAIAAISPALTAEEITPPQTLQCGTYSSLGETIEPGEFCGSPHDKEKYQKGRRGLPLKIYVPQTTASSQVFDNIACLFEAANDLWQTACPPPGSLPVNPIVPSLEVIRGERPNNEPASIQVSYIANYLGGKAAWEAPDNNIVFSDAEDWSCSGAPGTADPHHRDIAAHEIGHALGLAHDFCPDPPTPKSIMTTKPQRGTTYNVRPEHCEAIEEINCREDCSSNLMLTEGEDCPCCFFCTIPPLQDRCLLAPALCGGGYADPSEGYCIYRETTWVVIGVVEEEHLIGTTLTYFTLSEMTSTSIDCYTWNLGGDPPQETSQESVQPGEGPLVFVRSRYPEGLAGTMPLSGVARDDTYGITSLNFWIDGVPAAVSGLQMGLHDPHTCTERPAAGCDANSRFEALLDVSALADGPHTLQVLAVNGRVVDPIPTYYEIPIEVRNAGTCSGDGVGPAVSLTQPVAGASVQGTVGVTCTASDPSGVEQVELYAAGAWKQSDPTAPYSFSLDSTGYPDGPLELRCRAEDACGNARFSAPVSVTVANGAPTTVTFHPTDDTFAHQDHPNSAFGAYNFLRLRTIDGGHGRHGYLKFQLGGISGAVTAAKLRLRTQETPLPESIGVYKLATTTWNENTLTWNNAPLDVIQSTILPGPYAADTWHELDITPLITGNGVLSLGLATGANQGKLDLWTKESLYSPELDVTFVPSATPAGPSTE